MTVKYVYLTIFFLLFSTMANAVTSRTTYQAKIVKPDGYPLEAANVNFRFTVLDPSASCVMYVEDYAAVNMTSSGGLISFPLGSGVVTFPASATSTTFSTMFDNAVTSFSCQSPGIYNPVSTDNRKIVMQFNDGNGWQTLPAMAINAVPYAMYAAKSQNSQKLNGKADTSFVEYSTLAALNCQSNEAIKFNGVSFGCIAVSSATTVTSGSVITALGYTPADGASVTALSSSLTSTDSNLASVSSSVFSVSSTVSSLAGSVSSLQNSVATSFAAITSSQWNNVASGISYLAGNVGLGTATPTAKFHIAAGTSSNAPFKFTSGTLLASPQSGTIEYNGTDFYFTDGTNTRRSLSSYATSLTSATITSALGYTPADDITVTNLSSTVATSFSATATSFTSLTNNINSVSSAVSNLQSSTAASFAAITNSQWNTSGTTINYTNGNVGIGTANPTTALDVNGHVNVQNGNRVIFNPTSGNNSYITAPGSSRLLFNVGSLNSFEARPTGIMIPSGNNIQDQNSNELLTFGLAASAVNNLNIDNAATGSNPVLGAAGSDANIGINITPKGTGNTIFTAGKVGIGMTPTKTLTVSGDALVNGVTVGVGGGNVALNIALGSTALYSNTTGSNNIAVGRALYTNTTGTGNTAIGDSVMYYNTTGVNNIGIGTATMQNNTTGGQNVAIGIQAMYMNTTGSGNVAIGSSALREMSGSWGDTAVGDSALRNTTTGVANTGLGNSTLIQNTTGSYNTGVGRDALNNNKAKSESTAVGYSSMFYADSTTTAATAYNTAIGAYSLAGSSTPASNTGIKNTALGHSALRNMTSGSSNTAVGYNAGSAITTGSNNVILGSNDGSSIATSSNNIIISDGAGNSRIQVNSSGEVGIGLATPSAKLHLAAGTSSLAPLKITSGTLLSSAQDGAIEYDGTNLYYTDSTNTRRALASTGGGSGQTFSGTNTFTGVVNVSNNTASTNSSTGAIVVSGGVGIGGALNVAGSITSSSNIQGVSVTATSGMISPYIYGSTSAAGSLTLDSTTHATKGNVAIAPNGGNVGIGTNAPISLLDLSAGNVVNGNTLTFSGLTLSNNTLIKTKTSSGIPGWQVNSAGGSAELFSLNDASGTAKFYVNTSTGNVGIGTSSPSYLLDIKKDTGSSPGFQIFNTSTTDGRATMFFRNDRTLSYQYEVGLDPGGGVSKLWGVRDITASGSPVRFAIASTGNVGIGTTNPSAMLDVADSAIFGGNQSGAGNYITIRGASSDNNWGGGIRFKSYGNTTVDNQIYNSTNGMVFSMNSSEKLRISTAGNVGIGTSSPTSRLHIGGGNIRLEGATSGYGLIDTFSTGSLKLSGYSTVAGSGGFVDLDAFGGASTDSSTIRFFRATSQTGTRAVQFFKGDGSATVHSQIGVGGTNSYFAGGGNVGIGTATPQTPLDVVGAIRTGKLIQSALQLDFSSGGWELGANRQYLRIDTNIPWANGPYVNLIIRGTDYSAGKSIDMYVGWYMYSSTFYAPHVTSYGGSTPQVSLANESGKVSVLLDLGSGNRWYYSALNIDVLYKSDSDPTHYLNWTVAESPFTGAATNIVGPVTANTGDRIFNGNIGIGTSTPSAKLDVVGGMSVDGLKIKDVGNSGSVGRWFKIGRIQNTNPIDSSETAYLSGQVLVQDDFGNTSSLQSLVTFGFGVRGGSLAPILFNAGSTSTRIDNDKWAFQVWKDSSNWHYLYFFQPEYSRYAKFIYQANAVTESWVSEDPTTVGGATKIWDSRTDAAQPSEFYGGLNALRGKVGIGTTSPSYSFQVQKISSAPAMMIGGGFAGSPRLQVYGLDADSNAWMGLGTDMGGNIYEHSVYFPTGPSNNGRLTIGDYNGTTYNTRMTVFQNGNVGIGTTSATSMLEVNGTFAATKITGVINSIDNRAVVDTPETFSSAGMSLNFKNNTTNSLSDGGTYNGVFTLRPYGNATDWTGGPAHQLGFTTNGNIFHRYGTGVTWNSWRRMIEADSSGNLDINGYSATPGVGTVKLRNSYNSGGTKYWQIGPDGNGSGNFVVYTDGLAGAYIVYGQTTWSSSSDRRIKKDIQPITDGLSKLLQLNGVTYHYTRDADTDPKKAGVIAQDVEKVLPEAITKDDKGFLSVKYTELIALVIEAVKSLYIQVVGVERQVASIAESKVDKAEFDKLKAENEALKAYLCSKDPAAPICK